MYYLRIDGSPGNNCEFNIQLLSGLATTSSLPRVYLGRDTVCASGCLTAPTGETISCNSGLYSFDASNDTTYYGEFFIDTSQELELLPASFNCNFSTGQWTVTLDWIGSSPPFSLNGEEYQNSFAQLGLFAMGDTALIVLAGSSFCVDPLFDEFIDPCGSLSARSIQSLGFSIKQLNESLLEINAPSFGWNLSLVDLLGREVYSTPLQQDSNQLFVGDLLPGTYFIVVQNESEMASEKWVKR